VSEHAEARASSGVYEQVARWQRDGITDNQLGRSLYAAAYILANRSGLSPREIAECLFCELPSDEQWRSIIEPALVRSSIL
jgi:hypothetical protein